MVASPLPGWKPLGRCHHLFVPQSPPPELEVINHSACSELLGSVNSTECRAWQPHRSGVSYKCCWYCVLTALTAALSPVSEGSLGALLGTAVSLALQHTAGHRVGTWGNV